MTKIVVYRDERFHIVKYEVKGHSGYGKEGEDIVCAGVSTLVESAALGILKYLNVKAPYEIEKGKIILSIPEKIDNITRGKIDAILESMLLGLKEIAKQYPKFVILHELEV